MTLEQRQTKFNEMLARHGFDPPRCYSHVHQGWWPILENLLPQLKTAGVISLAQVKQKFGGLRVYVDVLDEDADVDNSVIRALINVAETEAWKTCEFCGKPGKKQSNDGAIVTRCEDCPPFLT